jgi:tetratricopeptide (TPR) repeat protein
VSDQDRFSKLKLPIILAVLCATLSVACNQDPTIRKQKFYTRGVELLNKGKVREASLEFLNALKLDPQFAEAANVLAEINFQSGDYQKAYALLLQASHAKPDYLPARKGLLQLYRASGKFDEALNEADFILQRTPDDTDTLLNLAIIQDAQKKLADAEGTFNRVLEIQPNQVTAILGLAALKQQAKDLPAAEHYLRLALEKNPGSSALHLALIKYYMTSGRAAEAEALFPQALKATSGSSEVLAAQVGYYESQKKFTEAERLVRVLHSAHGNDPRYWNELADFYIRRNQWDNAKAELQTVLQQHRDNPASLHKLIEVHIMLNDRKTAEALNEHLLKKNPKDGYAHLARGRLYLAAGDLEKSLAEFNEAQRDEPTLPALHYWYAQAYLQNGAMAHAKQELQVALQNDPDYPEALVQLAELQNQTNGTNVALALEKRVLLKNPADVRTLLALSMSLILKKDYAQAAKVLKSISRMSPNNVEMHRQLGILELSRGNVPGARQEFKQAWDLQPDSKALLESVLLGYVVQKQTDAASDLLRKQIEGRPQDGLLYYELARFYFLQGKRPDAAIALKQALSLSPSNSDAAIALAELYADDHKSIEAAQITGELIRKNSGNPGLLVRCGAIYEKLRLWNEARGAYERVVQLDHENAVAKNNLAWVLTEHGGNIDLALTLAQEAKEKLADNLQVTDTIGWIYYKKHVYKMALDYLKQCAEKDQKNPTFQYHLGMAYSSVGRIDEARQSLLNALRLAPDFPEAEAAREALAHL